MKMHGPSLPSQEALASVTRGRRVRGDLLRLTQFPSPRRGLPPALVAGPVHDGLPVARPTCGGQMVHAPTAGDVVKVSSVDAMYGFNVARRLV